MLGSKLLALLAVVGRVAGDCGWTDPASGTQYDLSSLTQVDGQKPWYGNDEDYNYQMNVCGPARTGGRCEIGNGLLCQFYKNNATDPRGGFVSIIATTDEVPTWSLLDETKPTAGVKAVYTLSGQDCTIKNVTAPRRAEVSFQCNHKDFPNKQFLIHEDATCLYSVTITSPYACPVEALPGPINPNIPTQGSVTNGTWVYYTINVGPGDKEVQIKLDQDASTHGDPDVYMRRGLRPTKDDYDYKAVSSGKDELLVVRRNDKQDPLVDGTFVIGIFAFGQKSVKYTVTVNKFACYGACSGHGVCTNGVCQCNEGYVVPILDDCSAQVKDIAMNKEGTFAFDGDDTQTFFRFTINDTNVWQLQVNVDWSNENSSAIMLVNKGTYPTRENNMGMATNRWYGDKHALQVSLSQNDVAEGEWYVSLSKSAADKALATPYNITVNTFDCESGCSGHGTCDAASHQCSCEKEYSGHHKGDCSVRSEDLTTKKTVLAQIASYETLYFAVDVTAAEVGKKELILATATKTQNTSYPSYPRIYMSYGTFPNRSDHDASSPLPLENTGEIVISPFNLKAGVYYVSIPNTRSFPINVSVSLSFRDQVCPNPADAPTASGSPANDGYSTGTVVGLSILFLLIGGGIGYFVAGMKANKNRKHRILEDGINSDGSYNPPFIDDN